MTFGQGILQPDDDLPPLPPELPLQRLTQQADLPPLPREKPLPPSYAPIV